MNTPVPHGHDPLGRLGHALVMGDEQDRLPAAMQAPEQLEHLGRARRVERTGGLVREQQRRLVHQRPGDREPLALAAGEDAGELVRLRPQPEQVEQAARSRLALAARAARDYGRQHHVLEDAHPLEQVEELEHETDVHPSNPSPFVFILARERMTGQDYVASGRRLNACNEVQEGGLSTARRTHDCDELASLQIETRATERAHGLAAGIEALAKSADKENLVHTKS